VALTILLKLELQYAYIPWRSKPLANDRPALQILEMAEGSLPPFAAVRWDLVKDGVCGC